MRLMMTMTAVAALSCALPVAAQTSRGSDASGAIEGRVDRLEREMRAVQRKVFPGGAGQTIEPQITPPQQQGSAPGMPASGALSDLTADDLAQLLKGVSAHSTRVGLNQDLFASGEDLAGIMDALRWKSPRMPLAYNRNLAAEQGAAGRLIAKIG